MGCGDITESCYSWVDKTMVKNLLVCNKGTKEQQLSKSIELDCVELDLVSAIVKVENHFKVIVPDFSSQTIEIIDEKVQSLKEENKKFKIVMSFFEIKGNKPKNHFTEHKFKTYNYRQLLKLNNKSYENMKEIWRTQNLRRLRAKKQAKEPI